MTSDFARRSYGFFGRLGRTLSGGNYGFSGPYDIAADGTRVWVANNTGHSVTELTVG